MNNVNREFLTWFPMMVFCFITGAAATKMYISHLNRWEPRNFKDLHPNHDRKIMDHFKLFRDAGPRLRE
jgi:hypothetical protein